VKLYLLSESNLYAKTLLPEFIRTKKMIFLNQKECIELANKNNIFIIAKKI